MGAERFDIERSILNLQSHLCGREVRLPGTAKELRKELMFFLWNATDEGLLRTKKEEVAKLLKISDSPVPGKENVGIFGGEKDLKRRGDQPHFIRADGAWFHFSLTVGELKGRPLTLPAYDFELCFPENIIEGTKLPRFLRFDLNPPDGRANEAKGLRCHMHPGHEPGFLVVAFPRLLDQDFRV